MHLIGSLALVCCLLLGYVAPWDLKDDYFKEDYDRNKKCEQESRIMQMSQKKNLHQCLQRLILVCLSDSIELLLIMNIKTNSRAEEHEKKHEKNNT